MNAYRITPYIKAIKPGDWVSTRGGAHEFVFLRATDSGNVEVRDSATGAPHELHPSQLFNVMVRDK